MPTDGDIARLLASWRAGDKSAAEALKPLVQLEIQDIVERQLRLSRGGHTLQPAAVLNEAWLRVVEQRADWRDRGRFFAVAAETVRRLLVDRARRWQAGPRGAQVPEDAGDLLALDRALDALQAVDASQAKVVELRYFGGLTTQEAAEVLRVSEDTVMRDWKLAKAWLYQQLQK